MSANETPDTVALPRLYAIVDIDCLLRMGRTDASAVDALSSDVLSQQELLNQVLTFAGELHAGGVTLMQYRAKQLPARLALMHARELRRALPEVKLIMNDRADLCLGAEFDGVHVGQDDLAPEAVRKVVGKRIVGVSTHNPEQVFEASASPADYVAIGPVFSTGSKLNPDPVVGLDGVRRARELTDKPLVAIGGITLENCLEVIEAGADSLAIISGLLTSPRESAKRFLYKLR